MAENSDLEFAEETEKIISSAIEVHKVLGPGFLETIYENALSLEFESRSIPYNRQWETSVFYNGKEVGKHRWICLSLRNLWLN